MIKYRWYQQMMADATYDAWAAGHKNVLAVAPTGSGKTVFFSGMLQDHRGMSVAIAHRQELVSQMSRALNANEVPHRIISSDTNFIKYITAVHRDEHGYTAYDPNAPCAVAGVDTLIRRKQALSHFFNQVTKWIIDEGHHVTEKNKWGTAANMFSNARGLAVTATPIRADGIGLGRGQGGLMDTMVEGPTMRQLIDDGYLTDYIIYAPATEDLDLSTIETGKSGDYKQQQLSVAVHDSSLVGDVVEHYIRIAPDKLGVTFATNIEEATDIARRFNERDVRAEVVTAKTPDRERRAILKQFAARQIMQLVNVDLFGEGFDLPAIEVVSMARPTASYSLYCQQFGRALRPMEGKGHAIIIDHVGNVLRHGLPDANRVWSLDARNNGRMTDPDDEVAMKNCVECTRPYPKYKRQCPHCGFYHVPATRDSIQVVDGDLIELSPEVLAQMRKAVDEVDQDPNRVAEQMRFAGAPEVAWRSAAKQCKKRQEIQHALRESIAWWAGYQRDKGRDNHEIYRLFYHLFGTDVLTAKRLGKPDALVLADKINRYLGRVT